MLYKHTVIGTDISIHLFHESDKIELSGSPIGLQLTKALKEYGMTNHTVWVNIS